MKHFYLGIAWTCIIEAFVFSIFLPAVWAVIAVISNMAIFLLAMGFKFLGGSDGKSPRNQQKEFGGGPAERAGSLPPGHHFHPVLGHVVCTVKGCKCNAIQALREGNEWHFESPDFTKDIKPMQGEIDKIHNQRIDGVKNAGTQSQKSEGESKHHRVSPVQGSVGQGDRGSVQ